MDFSAFSNETDFPSGQLTLRFCVQMRANFWPIFLLSGLNHSNVLKVQKVENSILNLKNDI